MRNILLSLLFVFLSFSLNAAPLRHLQCKVIGISDGDTLTCLYNRTQLKVRLQHIDAPESAQAFGNKAKQSLAVLAFKKNITLEISGYDKYQRLLAVAYDLQGNNINLRQVQQGMAWAYRQTQPIYEQAQAIAKQQHIGLWQDKHPINPADWRAIKRSDSDKNLQNFPQNRPLVTMNCNVKLSCNKIADYETAKRYFQQCGWKELDGNNDGIPCNKLYRKEQKR
ncbi:MULTISPECIES: thermonuclease family protein [Glaesserella]|uniref:Nuclease n=1 Tax=Glaesserella australis TaxID=2094024 RepID=A0A328C3Y6_9PAST|nr:MULTISPECIES: thermonuclease family protein [Glaesserella]AUI66222.1 nuclease [Glaesserella sp. 15-184]RAL19244.1 nuclease [Glaesserella australis]